MARGGNPSTDLKFDHGDADELSMNSRTPSSLLSFSLEPYVPRIECPEHGVICSHAYTRDTAFCLYCGLELPVSCLQWPAEEAKAAQKDLIGMLTTNRLRSMMASVLDNHVGLHGLEIVQGDRGGEGAADYARFWDLLFASGWMRLSSGQGGGPQWVPTAQARQVCESIAIYGQHSDQRPSGSPPF